MCYWLMKPRLENLLEIIWWMPHYKFSLTYQVEIISHLPLNMKCITDIGCTLRNPLLLENIYLGSNIV